MAGALAGLRVVELATGVAGPYCGKLFAGLGADVLKIEPSGGDPSRSEGPFPDDIPDPERSGLFLHLNTGKRSVVLDLTSAACMEALPRYLAAADAVIIDRRPSELQALGIDFDRWQDDFPQLVVTSITPFGLSGPYANYLGSELIVYALSGYGMLTGAPDRQPIKSYGSLIQYEAGAQAALGALAALFARERDGRGQLVDVSAMEAGTFLLGGVEQPAHFFGRIARRNGTRLLGFAPQYSYPSTIRPCKDGYVHCHSNNRHLDLLGVLIPDPRLREPDLLAAMMAHADEIDAIMDRWLADKDRREVVRRAQELRLPFTEVMLPGEVMADPHHRERGSFVTVQHEAAGPVLQPGAPFRLWSTPWETRGAPALPQRATAGDAGTSDPAPATWTAGGNTPQDKSSTEQHDAAVPSTPQGGNAQPRRPLAGLRVVDFTNAVAGPIATFLLADLGADVIKVEAPNGRHLQATGAAPRKDGSDERPYNRVMLFNELNHGKRGVVLDVARAEGRAAMLRLAARADVLIENFAPRVMGNLKLDYADLRAANPSIIMVSMPAFGLSGPYRDRGSYGPGVDAMSGLSHLTGYADGPPMKPGNFFCDQNAGVHTAFATLAALWHRNHSGDGQRVEMPMIEGEFQVVGDAYIDYALNGRERYRSGNDHPWMAPHDVFPCQGEDAWIAIAVESDEQWRALCRTIDRADLAHDQRFAEGAARHAHRAELEPVVSAWTRARGHIDAQDILQASGVPAGAVLHAGEVLANEHVRARGGFTYVDVPDVGAAPYPRMAFTLSRTPALMVKAAPGFGEDNDAVFIGLLGMTESEVAGLEAAGVTARVPVGGH